MPFDLYHAEDERAIALLVAEREDGAEWWVQASAFLWDRIKRQSATTPFKNWST